MVSIDFTLPPQTGPQHGTRNGEQQLTDGTNILGG